MSDQPISKERYEEVQQSLQLLSSVVRGLPLDEFIAAAERSLEVGPYVDPTLYREASAKLQLVLDTAKLLRELQSRVERAVEEGVIK